MSFDFIGPYLPTFIKSTMTTIEVSFIALFFGFIIGLILCLGKLSNNKIFKVLSSVYVEVIRDTPLLVQLSIIYYGLPQIGINFPSIFGIPSDFIAGSFALSINSGAYIAEIMRSGIQSVDKGQMEASRSLGLNYWATMRYVIVPQAIKNILPSLANEFVALVKESAILSFIGVIDIMFTANTVKNATYDSFGPYLFAAAIYFVLTFALSKLVGLLEKKMAASN
ncbi:amino acid ABC transporter permease [Peptacetobacter hominis]|uniref:Amino acid ABC transporter permease n=1 Tax=Peptacetobacter hominis TaxID=2743610 RepID=A0A544QW47_9FIRM|nr:amino acid ABC transporter permease [Peptacetobacter hominis]TQQ84906.1 amino acid ABC transporter permease [Peptacetobacter hominis]